LDGWTDPSGKSLWNFIIHTADNHEYLWKLKDLSHLSHTSQLLKESIQEILEEIGNEKFSAIVTDGGSNCDAARQLIVKQYPHILNLKCVAHCLNLISGDILKHNFADRIRRRCSILVNFFNSSHQLHALLIRAISEKGIIGGGLKKFVKTRWTSVYECVSSVYRLKICIEEV
jgi:hypothetical protein